MDNEQQRYTVSCGGQVICRESYLGTAIQRAFEESEIRLNQPVEVTIRGDSGPLFWRVEHG